jgi:hypothetical protein
MARVNGETHIEYCTFDKKTNFTGVGLDSATIDPGLKTALKDNIRRLAWKKWLSQDNWKVRILKNIFVRPFWVLTDYGSSTQRIIFSFFILSILFGAVYFAFESIPGLQGVVKDLRVEPEPAIWHVLWRSMYFSIVTMTTLGFGDMHAVRSADIWGFLGSFLLSLQVILGYVMLGALVTRLGILFTNDAPAAKPAKIKKRPKADD